jgi:hypothetical protein
MTVLVANPYCQLNELRRWVIEASIYNASTIAFVTASKTITDTTGGLKRFTSGQRLQVSGSASNNGYYTIATGGLASPITVNESLVNESVGASVTISDVTDPTDDDDLIRAINTATENIEELCRRRFWTNSVDEVRYYTTEFDDMLFIPGPDIISVTSILTDSDGDGVYENTWAASDYVLLPLNAVLDGSAYRRVSIAPRGNYVFPTAIRDFYPSSGAYRRNYGVSEVGRVQITGKFGYPIQNMVKQACLIQAHLLFKAKDSPYGVIGQTEYGIARIKDPFDSRAYALIVGNIKDFP